MLLWGEEKKSNQIVKCIALDTAVHNTLDYQITLLL